jgi:hypothetical protein
VAAGAGGSKQQQWSGSSSTSSASSKGRTGLAWLLGLPRSTLTQLGVLCYSHAVMGYA